MRDAIRTATTAAALAIFAAMNFPSQASSTTVDQFFNKMSEDEESAYVITMATAAEKSLSEVGKPELARRVEALFPAAEQQSDGGGIGEFKEAVDAFTRQELVREATGEKSKDGPFLIEEMMVKQLQNHQIELPRSFMAAVRAGKFPPATARREAPTSARPPQPAPAAQPKGNYWPDPPDDPFGGDGGFIH